ncbi:hypothetical protein ACWCOT_45190 [Nonomuraea bangladeshensis]
MNEPMDTRIRIATTSAAPSVTAIFDEPGLAVDDQGAYVSELLPLVWARGWTCTKAIVIRGVHDGEVLVDFIQVRGAAAGAGIRVETRGDCGNSMVAAMLAVSDETGRTDLRMRNRCTGVVASIRRCGRRSSWELVEADFTEGLAGRSADEFVLAVPTDSMGVPVSVLDAMNPYVIVHAADIGATADTLIARDPGPALLDRLCRLRRHVGALLGGPLDGEFPKAAIACRGPGRQIVGRTIYLGQWHPGLPLTGGITLALAALAPGTVLFGGECAHVSVTDGRSKTEAEITRDASGIRRCLIRGLQVALLDELILPTPLTPNAANKRDKAWKA